MKLERQCFDGLQLCPVSKEFIHSSCRSEKRIVNGEVSWMRSVWIPLGIDDAGGFHSLSDFIQRALGDMNGKNGVGRRSFDDTSIWILRCLAESGETSYVVEAKAWVSLFTNTL